MEGDNCSVCGTPLYGKQTIQYYELTHTYMSNPSYPSLEELEPIQPTTMHEYFCGEACLVKFVRERIEPNA